MSATWNNQRGVGFENGINNGFFLFFFLFVYSICQYMQYVVLLVDNNISNMNGIAKWMTHNVMQRRPKRSG